MKILATILIIAAIIWCMVPQSSADLNAWYSGGPLVLTNSVAQVGLTVNGFAGQTNDVLVVTGGGTNDFRVSGPGQLLAADGAVARPSFSFGSVTNTGIYINANALTVVKAGSDIVRFDDGKVEIPAANQWAWSSTTSPAGSVDTILARDSAATVQIGADAAAVVTPQTLKAADGTGTDHNGASLQLQSGQSTGAGVPGDLIYRTSLYTNGSGSTANAYVERGRIVGRPSSLTNNTATSFQRFTMATNTMAGIRLFCTAKATDAAFARQCVSAAATVDAVNVNGTITAQINSSTNTTATSSGTLALALTVVDEGSNVLAIRANANTSLTATPSIKWVIVAINSDGAITVTPVQL